MKKIFVILFFLPLFSCNDWLNVESEKSVTFLNYFKSEQDLEKVLISIFGYEKSIFAPNYLDAFGWCGLQCDDAGRNEGYRTLEPESYFNERGMDSWAPNYSIIYLANLLEENEFRYENISEERAAFWLAQGKFAKALAYFYVIQQWKEAPLAPGTETIEPRGKSPVEDLLQEAIKNAEGALTLPIHENLKGANGNPITSKQFASLGTVHTLLANIYAWMGGLYGDDQYWREAEKHASLVIDNEVGFYALEPTVALMKKNVLGGVRLSNETIFAIEQNAQDDNRFDALIYENSYPGQALTDYPYTNASPAEIESDYNKPTISVETVEEIFPEENDARRQEYWYQLGKVEVEETRWTWDDDAEDFVVVIDTVLSTFAFFDKWNEPIFSQDPDAIAVGNRGLIAMDGNRVVWRLADLILLRAECRARLGLATAVDDLNRIRRRADLDDYSGPTDSESLRKEIFRERERELFGEGQRYFDVVRNGYFREELSRTHAALTDEDVRNGALYLPVSRNSFIDNTLMKQNIYWLWRQQ